MTANCFLPLPATGTRSELEGWARDARQRETQFFQKSVRAAAGSRRSAGGSLADEPLPIPPAHGDNIYRAPREIFTGDQLEILISGVYFLLVFSMGHHFYS